MTLAEIYANVAGLVYGDIAAAPPPAHEITQMQTLILAKHRECQLGYNYWFQKVVTTQAIVAGTSAYTWPVNFKELIELDLSYSQTATGFTLDSAPTEDDTVDFIYWCRFATPTAWAGTYEDAPLIYLNWFIIFAVAADMFWKRGEKNDAQLYRQLAEDAMFKTQQEDYHRRQTPDEIF